MIIKPPPGIPRSCWNIYDGKQKKGYDDRNEAEDMASVRFGYQAYFCKFCDHYHIGRVTKENANHYFQRRPELEIELGTRTIAHLRMGDTIDIVKKRWKSAIDMRFRTQH